MSLLEIKDINMNYHTIEGVTEALRNINFSVDEGEFISIIGPSGCGKSTLLNIISGILTPSSGEVKYNDPQIKTNLDKMGYMFQKDYLFPWLTVRENVLLGLKIKNIYTKENIEFADKMLECYGLLKFKSHKPTQLSGGMRQRVALIRTLVLKPEVLLLDEPFSALDYQSRLNVTDDVYEIIKKERKTAIMVTHDLGEAIVMSKRVIILTSRPATIKDDVLIEFKNKDATPFDKRKEPEFNVYFRRLWGELDDGKKQ
ncbi:ABC transporter ATP-binding protein [Clostridium celatum]|uniref:ABC transporter, ATP-binding protein n=1 Tax=Clostridium celatum DSM 1785 TaxID=545697 RepID=L1QEQ0_9CLOT|nr:ABC transporter ATP-binding protein [Clostridium celatum]EKY26160.1 ABC transporter, ATP-binding protein [Clostridium celatum DSM 1785]MCE9654301.1 ABC transporter ATP-binding protein [Clostridium celatum]